MIVAFGDSLTAGFGAEPGKSFPDFLQKDLDAAGLHWRVVNAGVSGNTTTDGVEPAARSAGLQTAHHHRRIWRQRWLARAADRDYARQPGANRPDAAATPARQLLLAGMTLPPNYGPDYIQPFQQIYVDLAAKYKVTRIPFLLEGVATHPDLMQRDGIHPTAQGNEIVAKTVMRYLKPLLH